jgi:hypothetical protein
MRFSYFRDDNDVFPGMKKLFNLYQLRESGNLKSFLKLQKTNNFCSE